MLRPEKDKAFLIHFDFDVELLQDLTSSREKLEAALRLLEATHMRDRPGRDGNGPEGDPGEGGQEPRGRRGPGQSRGGGPGGGTTTLADAIYLASNELMRPQTGRKAMIVLGDGDDIGSKVSMAQAITAAQRADTLIYTIRIFDKDFGADGRRSRFGLPGMGGPGVWGGGPPGGGGGGRGQGGPPGGGGAPPERANGKKNLQEISRRTGGVYSEVSKKQPLDQIYSAINEELRSQYSLGYTPDLQASAGYRRIKVTAKREGIVIQAREGYYADSKPGS